MPLHLRSMVGEIECPYQHHGALYDDVINAHPYKFSLANQKAQFPNLTNQSTPSIKWVFFVGGLGARHFTDFRMSTLEKFRHFTDFRLSTDWPVIGW